jgi:DNA phosphorothioation-dependent restriction protein DptH
MKTRDLIVSKKIEMLALKVAEELEQRQIGHCLRIDHLTYQDCLEACDFLRDKNIQGCEFYVLSDNVHEQFIPVDTAIEYRNRKRTKLCIFVPSSLQDVAQSSLGNSFSPFPLKKFLQDSIKSLIESLEPERKKHVKEIQSQLRGGASVPDEKIIDFLAVLHHDKRLVAIGENLWRVGLLPDLRTDYEDFARIIELNRICVDTLARPLRPQASLSDKISELKLKPNSIQQGLTQFLFGKRLTSDFNWLEELASKPNLTFDNWKFPDIVQSDLEAVTIEPLYEGGVLRKNTGLRQDGPGTIPIAPCGPKCKIKIKWSSDPARPKNVAKWLVELVPNPEEYPNIDIESLDFPKKSVKGSSFTASLPLNFEQDLINESDFVRNVVVRVSAQDESGILLRNFDTFKVINDVSQQFYLEPEDESDTNQTTAKLPTSRCFADALLQACLNSNIGLKLPLNHLNPIEKDLSYFQVEINEKSVARMATSTLLFKVEQKILDFSSSPMFFSGTASEIDVLEFDDLHLATLDINSEALTSQFDKKLWTDFINIRIKIFDLIQKQKARSICSLWFSKDCCDLIIKYAKAFDALCEETLTLVGKDSADFIKVSKLLANLDTLEITLPGKIHSKAKIHLATHPTRLLWLAAYSEWMESIVDNLSELSLKARKKLIDADAFKHLSPTNVPAWSHSVGTSPYVFVDNLNFIYGVSVPADVTDPAAVYMEVARVLGFSEPDSNLTTIEGPRLAEQLRSYRKLHPYISTLRVAAVNTGNSDFLTSALLEAMRPDENETQKDTIPKLDIVHCLNENSTLSRSDAERFLAEWQNSSASSRGDHLRPSIQVALNRFDFRNGIPGNNVHLTTMLDGHATYMSLESGNSETSDSKRLGVGSLGLFGLICRFESHFETEEGSIKWTHRQVLDVPQTSREHPVRPAYSKCLFDLYKSHSALTGASMSIEKGSTEPLIPVLCTEINHEGLQKLAYFHEISDWVLSIDKHFGIEYFDSPNDIHIGRDSQKFLLDYVPEFIEGLGHRQIMTTNWLEEVSQIMKEALSDLNISDDDYNCLKLLNTIKSLSGRLALKLVSESSFAKETIGLAVAIAHLNAKEDLKDAIIVPLDAHKDFFMNAKKNKQIDSASRCDLLIVRGKKNRIDIEFIEVKWRRGLMSVPEDLQLQMSDQTHNTDNLLRSVFFPSNPRLDHSIYLCRLSSILRFYLKRAKRHGRISSQESYSQLLDAIGRIELGQAKLISQHKGVIVNIGGREIPPFRSFDTEFTVISDFDIENSVGLNRSSKSLQTISNPETSLSNQSPTPSPSLKAQMEENILVDSLNEPSIVNESNTKFTESVDDVKSSHENLNEVPNSEIVKTNEMLTIQSLNETVNSDLTTSDHSDRKDNSLTIELGTCTRTDSLVVYEGKVSGSPHMFILGIPGQGKSWALQRIVSESARQGVPSIILDFHGQFSDPNGVTFSRAKPLVFDASLGLPFSPFELGRSTGADVWKKNAYNVAEIVSHVCSLGEIQKNVVYDAIKTSYEESGFLDDDSKLPTMSEVHEQIKKIENERKGVRNTSARCLPLFEFGLFAENIESRFSFSDAYRTGLVVDLHNLEIEATQNGAGSFVLRKLYKDMFSWGETDKLRLMVVLDEAHRLAKDITLPKIMKEGRKYGVAVIVASQSLQDFHPEVLENAGTKISFRLNHPQDKQARGFFKARPHSEDLALTLNSLKVGQALVQTPLMSYAAKTNMSPLT